MSSRDWFVASALILAWCIGILIGITTGNWIWLLLSIAGFFAGRWLGKMR